MTGRFEHSSLLEYYAEHRNRVADLYPSERRFLPWLAMSAQTVLDVGCAAGGFANIWRAFNPALRYTGVDGSTKLIDAARKLHPECGFLVGDCVAGLPVPDRASAIVSALGWLHWEPRYREALAELWRVTERYLLIDLRLHPGAGDLVGQQKIGETQDVPYICVSWPDALEALLGLEPFRLLGYGYLGVADSAVSEVPPAVGFATFVLERSESTPSEPADVCLDLPFGVSSELASTITLYPASRLRSFAPEDKEEGSDA
jgi:SAM-dependent methyltransferase